MTLSPSEFAVWLDRPVINLRVGDVWTRGDGFDGIRILEVQETQETIRILTVEPEYLAVPPTDDDGNEMDAEDESYKEYTRLDLDGRRIIGGLVNREHPYQLKERL